MIGKVTQLRNGNWCAVYLTRSAVSSSKNRVLAWLRHIELGESGLRGDDCHGQSRQQYPYNDSDDILVTNKKAAT